MSKLDQTEGGKKELYLGCPHNIKWFPNVHLLRALKMDKREVMKLKNHIKQILTLNKNRKYN